MIKKVVLTTTSLAKKRSYWLVNPLNFNHFGTLYNLFKQFQPNNQVYKSMNLKFQNQGLKMVAYQFSPDISENHNESWNAQRHIRSDKIITLNFLTEVEEGMEDDVWKNRKAINLNLKECIQLFKIDSLKEEKITIEQQTFSQGQQNSEKHSFYIDFSHNREKKEVQIQITHSKSRNQINTHLWDMHFMLHFNQFKAFCQWIRSGIYYTSGTATMVEYSKQLTLLLHSTQRSYNKSKKNAASTDSKNKK